MQSENDTMANSVKKIAVITLVAIILLSALYSALTFPRDIVKTEVSFSIGADQEREAFSMPVLHDRFQVEVIIGSGSALWSATITNAEGTKIWEHAKAQGDQTSYTSDWISLPSGNYNFTFGAIGIGELQANVKVTSKGGFW